MENKYMTISFKGRNNGFAIAIMNHINMMKVFFLTFVICLIPVVILVCLGKYSFLFLLIIPFFIFVLSFIVFLFVKYDDRVFLSKCKKEHDFKIVENIIFKSNKEIKLMKNIRVYKYRKFLFMITSHSYYVISNKDYEDGNRELFLGWLKKNHIKCIKGY